MEKCTITRLGEEKTVAYTNKRTGKPDSFNKVGFMCSERGQQWINFIFRGGSHGLAVGSTYDMDLTSKEFNGKTYWDAKMAKNSNGTDKVSKPLEISRLENLVSLKVIPMLEELLKRSGGQISPNSGYPENELDAPPF